MVTPITSKSELELARKWWLDGPWPEAEQNNFPTERLFATIDFWAGPYLAYEDRQSSEVDPVIL